MPSVRSRFALPRSRRRNSSHWQKNTNRIVGVTYGYTGAQMIHQARHMIQEGMLGEIRIINMQFGARLSFLRRGNK